MPLVALGVLLVVGCAIGFSSAWLRAGGHQQVLVVANDLSTGQILTSSDLKTVQISGGNGLSVIPASQAAEMVGRPVAQPITSGSLLIPSDLGSSVGPPQGRAMVGLALKPGQYPPGVAAGERVLVVLGGGSGSAASGSTGFSPSSSSNAEAPLAGTVVSVEQAPANSSESIIVSVQLAEGNGAAVASAASAGNVALAVVSSKAAS
ncbi:MAG TPA: SAF domain-containing protein [Acidimicrobiales bacterium]|nr:SAF domain-containing protein [Acidimicrobiales bacterium]